MITPAYALTATERVLPRLALDFTTAILDPRVTFTRTTGASNPATYIDSSGYVTAATNNQPRFDYNAVTLVCKGLLIEESRTNAIDWSNDFSSGRWTWVSGATTSAAATTSPDNTTNAWKLMRPATGGGNGRITKTLSLTSGTTYTFSVFAAPAEVTQIYFADDTRAASATFNLSTGAVVSTSNIVSSGSEQVKNGFWRYWITYTANTTASHGLRIQAQPNSGGAGTDGIYIWGAQHEMGAFATSYIPTGGSALTRNADVATMTGTNFSDWFNASEGTFVARSASLTTAAATRSIFDVRSATTIRMGLQNFGTFGSFVAVDTTTQASLDGTSAVAANTFFQIAGGYKVNDFGCAANGGAIVTDTSGTVPVANVAWIGGVNGTSVRNGWISNIWYYPQKLTSAQISAFSKQG